MMPAIGKAFRTFIASRFFRVWMPIALALAGLFVYLAWSVHFAVTQRSTIDEGLYLFKGLLYANGTYHPFQEYGPRTEYGPLAYLVQGMVQLAFGPSLLAGRVFAVILGVISLTGLWLAARRLARDWWAAAAVWAVALNPAVIRFYSFAQSQGIVACLLVWTLALSLDKKQRTLQACLAAVLAALLLLIRQNMAPVLPILLVYIFWAYGRRQGLWALLAGLLTVLAGHLAFWPGILGMWAPWLPASLTPFLDSWRLPSGLNPVMEFNPHWSARAYSLLEGLRFHFLPVAGSVAALVLMPARKAWRSDWAYKAGAYLAVLFFLLLVIHVPAGLGYGGVNYSNAFTVNPYLAFFNYAGILFIVAVLPNIQPAMSRPGQVLTGFLVVIIAAAVGFGDQIIAGNRLLAIHVPRLKTLLTTGQLLPSQVTLSDFLDDRLHLPFDTLRWMGTTFVGLLIGLLVLAAAWGIWALLRSGRLQKRFSFGTVTVLVFLVAGLVLSPTYLLGGGFNQWNCKSNVVQAYSSAGQELAQVLTPEEQVFWKGGNAPAVLLSAPWMNLQPQELDDEWNFFLDGDPDALARLGFWNMQLSNEWLHQAKVVVMKREYLDADWKAFLQDRGYTLVLETESNLDCSVESSLLVWRRTP